MLWQQQLAAGDNAQDDVHPLYATADGGIVATTSPASCPPGDIAQVNAPSQSPANYPCQQEDGNSGLLLPWDAGYGQLGTLYTLDQNGSVTSQAPDTGAEISWVGNWYDAAGATVSDDYFPWTQWATSYTAMAGGNLSSNGAAVGVTEGVEGLPLYAMHIFGVKCSLPTTPADRQKVPLGGGALQQYNSLKQALLASGDLTCTTCANLFSADPTLTMYFNQLTAAVTRQVPYDGLQTDISFYDAGALSQADLNDLNKVNMYKKIPVCGWFEIYKNLYGTQLPQGGSPATAASQIYPINGGTATDVYVNTNDLKHFSQGTILHEALHNLTGFYDSTTATTQGLEEHLGLDPNKDCPNGSVCITSKLQQSGCAGTQ